MEAVASTSPSAAKNPTIPKTMKTTGPTHARRTEAIPIPAPIARATSTITTSSASLSFVPKRLTTKSFAPGGWWSMIHWPIAATREVAPGRIPAISSETPRAAATETIPASAGRQPGRGARFASPSGVGAVGPVGSAGPAGPGAVGRRGMSLMAFPWWGRSMTFPCRRGGGRSSGPRPDDTASGSPNASESTWSRSTSAMGPAATARPACRTSAWSNPTGISSRWCETRTIANGRGSAASRARSRSSSSRAARSRLAVGSSSMRRSGSGMSARAIEVRRRSPADNVANGWSTWTPRPRLAARAPARSRSASS